MNELEGLTVYQYTQLSSLYVVLEHRGVVYPWDWFLWPESTWGEQMPRPVPNPSMSWRRPTYQELMDRHMFFKRKDAKKILDEYIPMSRTRERSRI